MREKSDWHRTFHEYCEQFKIFKNGSKRRNYASHSRMRVYFKAAKVFFQIEETTRYSGDKERFEDACIALNLKQLDELTGFLCLIRMELVKIEADPQLKETITKEYAGPPELERYYGKKPDGFDLPLGRPSNKKGAGKDDGL